MPETRKNTTADLFDVLVTSRAKTLPDLGTPQMFLAHTCSVNDHVYCPACGS